MASIQKIHAREILDSRGNPTVEVELWTENGKVRAKVPSGASTGVHEALELRDNDTRYHGKGVLKAVRHINEIIAPKVLGMDPMDQRKIDFMMIGLDGTANKSKLGANAILGVSLAVCRAGALAKGVPLYRHIMQLFGNEAIRMPVPCMNVINGGAHAGNALDIQEYMIMPVGARNVRDAVRMCSEVYHELKAIIKDRYGIDAVNVGDEGGFAPNLRNNAEPFELLEEAITKAGANGKVKIGIDAAASGFFKHDGLRYLFGEGNFSGEELMRKYIDYSNAHPLVSIEDPFNEEDFETFARLTAALGDRVQIVGDDLLVTNVERIRYAIERKACNALLLKVNQIGSVCEALDAARIAKDNGWGVMVSHRSGETDDDFIADLVVGIGCGQIKSGAPCRAERTEKYNQLMRIEEELESSGTHFEYAGEDYRTF